MGAERLAHPERFERPTLWFVARYSIQLSYGCNKGADYMGSLKRRQAQTAHTFRKKYNRGIFVPKAAMQPHDFAELAEFFRRFPVPVVILDLETTGGDFIQDRITEIAFLRFWQGKTEAQQQLVCPGVPISAFVSSLTGITDDMVAGAPPFAEIAPHILPKLRGSLLIAHNSRFDYTFLRHEYRRSGLDFATAALCSVQLSRKLYPEHHKHNLDSIIERHGILLESRHRAMSDVLAVAQYLQIALRERGAPMLGEWAERLANPPLLPDNLPSGLFQAALSLPDGHGTSVWYDAAGNVSAIQAHTQAYREIAAQLRHSISRPARLEFFPTVGALHSTALQAERAFRNGLLPAPDILRHTVRIAADVSGCLKARVRPLRQGFADAPPNGLFANAKAAKRALSAWARSNGICPALLGILPDELPQGAPCPVSLTGICSPACQTHDTALHNRQVAAALPSLPIMDWGGTPRILISERDETTGQEAEFVCDSGMLWLPEAGKWYCSQSLLALLKQKFKSARADIRPQPRPDTGARQAA